MTTLVTNKQPGDAVLERGGAILTDFDLGKMGDLKKIWAFIISTHKYFVVTLTF